MTPQETDSFKALFCKSDMGKRINDILLAQHSRAMFNHEYTTAEKLMVNGVNEADIAEQLTQERWKK